MRKIIGEFKDDNGNVDSSEERQYRSPDFSIVSDLDSKYY
jgi:hypothetical protein